MRNLIGWIYFKMGWLYMPKWLFSWMYIRPAVESWFENQGPK